MTKIPHNFIDISGNTYHFLTVISYKENGYWICQCSCDEKTIIIVKGSQLKNGHTKSCGCFNKMVISKLNKTHGMAKTSIYSIYRNMINRCYNKKVKCYKNYGGRGIKVCQRWLDGFENFYEDMGPRPSDKHSIDRIDNNGDYCLENCRWTTAQEQGNNRRNNRIVIYDNEEFTLTDLANKFNIDVKILHERLGYGWSIEKSVTTPIRRPRKKTDILEFDGKKLSYEEWSKKINVPIKTIWNRLDSGWSIESTLTNPIIKGRTKRK